MNFKLLSIFVLIFPLLGAVLIGLLNKRLKPVLAQTVAVMCVGASFILSAYLLYEYVAANLSPLNFPLYTWGETGGVHFEIGILLDRLSLFMITMVSFVSWMVHIYTIGYMKEDPGYQRFFSYILFFTFGMLLLVMSNNFLQLFVGWELVGLMSYLLIGFWFTRESAIQASLKAFIINRIGDFGFLIGIAAVLYYFNSLDYLFVFERAETLAKSPDSFSILGSGVSAITFICLCLFMGAVGKSAQMPLHVWLPDSMEGPTPISALIHAATMVTAGVFMVARLSPLFEYSDTALTVVLVIGTLTAFLTGWLGLVESDIKRIIAYSTLSQLGYMMAAMGVSAYGIGIYHLMTHAFFKALLFLGAGSCILALHHEQNIWKMGNLKSSMPITYWTMLIGCLALIGFPFFSGFYSKDLILMAVSASYLPFSSTAHVLLVLGVLITSLYTFRLFFVVFHAKPKLEVAHNTHPHEAPSVMWVPLVLLAIPSCCIGAFFLMPLFEGFFDDSFRILPYHDARLALKLKFGEWWEAPLDAFKSLPVWLGILGIFSTWVCYLKFPHIPERLHKNAGVLYTILKEKYGFDKLYQGIIMPGFRHLADFCWRVTDQTIIDDMGVNGTANRVNNLSSILRSLQTGYLYHYAFTMILGAMVLVIWLLLR